MSHVVSRPTTLFYFVCVFSTDFIFVRGCVVRFVTFPAHDSMNARAKENKNKRKKRTKKIKREKLKAENCDFR